MLNLFELPQDIAFTLLSEWLAVRDICAVDAAVCNLTLRPTFLNYLSNDAFVLTAKYHKEISWHGKGWYWLNNRLVGLECINLYVKSQAEMSDVPIDFLRRKGFVIKQCHLKPVYTFGPRAETVCLPLHMLIAIAEDCAN